MQKIIDELSSKLVFSVHLNFSYILTANLLRKIVLPQATGSLSKFLQKTKDCRLSIK
jgi:hypothetical protein